MRNFEDIPVISKQDKDKFPVLKVKRLIKHGQIYDNKNQLDHLIP